MASGWDMGMELGFASISASASAPVSNSPACLYGLSSSATDALRVDDLLDFSNHDEFFSSSSVAGEHHFLPPPSEASQFAVEANSSNCYGHPSSASFAADDIYIPSEEAAELEWLSRFVDDSFSDIPQTSYAYHAAKTHSSTGPQQHLHTNQSSASGRGARSKRSRATTATATWSAAAAPPTSQSSPSTTSSSSSSDVPIAKKENNNDNNMNIDKNIDDDKEKKGGLRRCTHCASEKTPQWRTGPMGPKTLCNACGVRYKSGRLVPEYRPAASPTFVLTQHSNSHRKVLELRRQKELLLHRGGGGSGGPGAAGELIFHDYEVC